MMRFVELGLNANARSKNAWTMYTKAVAKVWFCAVNAEPNTVHTSKGSPVAGTISNAGQTSKFATMEGSVVVRIVSASREAALAMQASIVAATLSAAVPG
jgi:hypothetical protein